jgi:hypothetical protein
MDENLLPLWKLALCAGPETFNGVPVNFSAKNLPGAESKALALPERQASRTGYDPIKAAEYLRKHYEKKSVGLCAMYVRIAMEHGGADTTGRPTSARYYAPTLKKIGYEKMDPIPKEYEIGDIMVFDPPYPEKSIHGHIQMWDGEKWGSDFRQMTKDFWPGSGYRNVKPKHEFFRYFMFFVLFAFSLTGCLANAKSPDDAQKLLEVLYESTVLLEKPLRYWNKEESSKYFSSEMVELLYKDYECGVQTGEICHIDWDILCECQDQTKDISVAFEIKSANPIQILVKITDFGEIREILFSFAEENGKLKISDLIRNGHSLKKMLKMPL